MLQALSIQEIKLIRIALSKVILSQKVGKYTDFNILAKKVDKFLDLAVENV